MLLTTFVSLLKDEDCFEAFDSLNSWSDLETIRYWDIFLIRFLHVINNTERLFFSWPLTDQGRQNFCFSISNSKVSSICTNRISPILFPFQQSTKDCYLSLWRPYLHINSNTIISDSNIMTQTCTCAQLIVQIVTSILFASDKQKPSYFSTILRL